MLVLDRTVLKLISIKKNHMIPSSLQHNIIDRLFSEQREYCSNVNKKGVYFIEKTMIRV